MVAIDNKIEQAMVSRSLLSSLGVCGGGSPLPGGAMPSIGVPLLPSLLLGRAAPLSACSWQCSLAPSAPQCAEKQGGTKGEEEGVDLSGVLGIE